MPRLIYHVWLKRESLPRDSRSHAPDEVRNKCLDLSRICIAVSPIDGQNKKGEKSQLLISQVLLVNPDASSELFQIRIWVMIANLFSFWTVVRN
jgi:hypothetical protein